MRLLSFGAVSFFYHSEQVQNYTLQKVQALKTCCEAKVRKRDESIDETTCCQAEKIWEQMKKGRDCEFQVWRVFLASLSTGRNHPCVEYCPTIRSFPRRRTLLRGGDFLFRHVSIANFEIQPLLRMFKLLWHNGTEITFLLWE